MLIGLIMLGNSVNGHGYNSSKISFIAKYNMVHYKLTRCFLH